MHEKPIEIRWSDVDSYDHVNNAAYLTYLEEVRDEWFDEVVAPAEDAGDFVLVRVAIDFRRELTLSDDSLIARCRLTRIGRTSVTTREEIWSSKGFLAAESESVLVAHDRQTRRSRAFAPGEKAALERDLAREHAQALVDPD